MAPTLDNMEHDTRPPPPSSPAKQGFALLQNTHRDMIQATAFNSYGDRFASSSVDGKIKVYNRYQDGTWNLCDTWGAHNGEILELQWLPPTIHPNLLASISADGRFKLWAEDPTVAPLKGRRFPTPVWELRATSRGTFCSFSITHNPSTRHTYLALIERSATIMVYENDEPENMANWTEFDKFLAMKQSDIPSRGDEASFKVQFDPNLEPCYNAIRQGIPKDALSMIVASMNSASIWRTREVVHSVSLGSNMSKEFCCMADLRGHRGLVRDIAWAPGNVRGFDIVATACKDGLIRIYEISTPGSQPSTQSRDYTSSAVAQPIPFQKPVESGKPSGIGAGLAGAREGSGSAGAGHVKHVVKEVSKLDAHRAPVWRVDFDDDGQLLGSTGDDGRVLLWRREPSGSWSKSSELAMNRSALPIL
ncbi:hypothetical protein BP6252_04347 [Coleophoma cylindrospora]|uniref:WD40 repeat-like protein n=1 Tax=Coleophoma cylindrospora TaxID=1849047 RepID=A0A3D8S088_9HELO|nr:hypothetical protein BP6252_04347 [Coleophoma cylindrospora]